MSELGKNGHSMVNILKSVKYDLKHNIVISESPPSLQYLTLCKIAISLWKSQFKKIDNEEEIKYWFYDVKFYELKILDLIPHLTILKNCINTLKSIITSMGNEIKYNSLINKLMSFDKYKVYLDNLCWNELGTFNTFKTAIKIIDDPNLSNLEKYELACDFCLKEKIRDLQKKLSVNDINNLGNKETYSMVAFWSVYINDENLPSVIKGVETRDYLRKCLVIPQSEVALQFIWENFADETWREQMLPIFYTILRNSLYRYNIALYFFKQMSQDQLINMATQFHFPVFEKLNTISKWNGVVSIQEYALDLIKTKKKMYDGFLIISDYWCFSEIWNVEDLIILWNEFVHHFKPNLEKEIVKFYKNIMFGNANAYKLGIIAQLIIRVANFKDRKNIIYSRRTMVFCQRLLCKENPQSFDLFLDQILKENDIYRFKKKFFKVRRIKICTDLIIERNYELLDKLLIKFCIDETVSEFKEKYRLNILSSVLKNVKKNKLSLGFKNKRKVKLLTLIWKFLSWCFDGNKKEMTRYKALVFDLDLVLCNDIKRNFFIILNRIIKRGNWNLVRKYWRWILSANKKNITNPKEIIALSKKILIATYGEECLLSYLKERSYEGFLKRFITSCFNPNEVEELKEELQHNEDFLLLVKELIELENLPEVEDLLKWCFSSEKNKIADFKNMFMNVFGCSLLFHFIERHNNIEKAKSVLTWFNPSVKLAESFKDRFISYIAFIDEIHIENFGHDEVTEEQEKEWKILDERIYECLEFLNGYTKRKSDLDKECKEVACQDSKKRKIMEEEGLFENGKRRKLFNINDFLCF